MIIPKFLFDFDWYEIGSFLTQKTSIKGGYLSEKAIKIVILNSISAFNSARK